MIFWPEGRGSLPPPTASWPPPPPGGQTGRITPAGKGGCPARQDVPPLTREAERPPQRPPPLSLPLPQALALALAQRKAEADCPVHRRSAGASPPLWRRSRRRGVATSPEAQGRRRAQAFLPSAAIARGSARKISPAAEAQGPPLRGAKNRPAVAAGPEGTGQGPEARGQGPIAQANRRGASRHARFGHALRGAGPGPDGARLRETAGAGVRSDDTPGTKRRISPPPRPEAWPGGCRSGAATAPHRPRWRACRRVGSAGSRAGPAAP